MSKRDKLYKYLEQDVKDPIIISGEQILKEFFPYWSNQMRKFNKEQLISEDRCIDDWCTINWAWEYVPKETQS